MKVSVIIPTYNGAHKILNVLKSLEKQSLMPHEVLVVVDGSTDRTGELLRSSSINLPGFKVIEQPNGGRAKVRNRGAADASGELLIFFDDDMRPLPNCVKEHVDFHKKFTEPILLAGSTLEDVSVMKTDIQKYKAFLSEKWFLPYKNLHVPLTHNNLFLAGANFSILSDTFWRLGGFDERLKDAEDYELGVRALSRNIPVYFEYNVKAWHDDFISAESYVLRQKQYKNANLLLDKVLKDNHDSFGVSKIALHMKESLYRIFSSDVWVKCIDRELFVFLPKSIRFKLYDLIIHSASERK